MFDSVMKRMREKIRTCQYVMTIHAEEEMDDDELSIFDVECCILRNVDEITSTTMHHSFRPPLFDLKLQKS